MSVKSYQRKFGSNLDVDTGSVPEDVWTPGDLIPWPTAAAATTVVSSSADDAAAGSGAQTIRVYGLLSIGGAEVEEDVTMNGTTSVALSNSFIRVYRVKVTSGDVNVGDIDILHGATTLCQIPAGEGQSLHAGWTAPYVEGREWYLTHWHGDMTRSSAVSGELGLYVREPGGVWQLKDKIAIMSGGSPPVMPLVAPHEDYDPRSGVHMPAGTDVRVAATASTAINVAVHARFWAETV